MTKRIIALFLCIVACVAVFAGCSKGIDPQSEDRGQQFTMYLSESIYDLDPVNAYTNESTRSVVGMLFDTLFRLDEKGKVRNSLAEKYTVSEDKNTGEYYMYIYIKEDARWSDNIPVTADDVVFAWKRVLSYNESHESAALLYDIKNARAYSQAEVTEDDIGLWADDRLVTIQFEGPIDYDQFILNLTSLALAPLREDVVSKNVDWAKKSSIMVSSGPFKLSRVGYSANGTVLYDDINYSTPKTDENNKVMTDRDGNRIYIDATEYDSFKNQVMNSFIIERNMYYYRNSDKNEYLDKSVTPYRIIVDCSMSAEDIKKGYESGAILYVGDIPLSIRKDFKDSAIKGESMSTNTCYFNQNAYIDNDTEEGYQLFAIKEVRQALSMAIDRASIARDIVFAEAATGLVPMGVFDSNSIKSMFRDVSSNNFKYLSWNLTEADALLKAANITPSDYSFSITVAAYDDVHAYIAEALVAAWGPEGLGFNVTIKERGTVANNDYHRDVKDIPSDLCDDLWAEDFKEGDFEVIIIDLVAPSVDPFSVLAPFAKAFSGQSMDMTDSTEDYQLSSHVTGYDSEEYNSLMEKIFAEKNPEKRSANLHNAEAILMEDMPVIPIVFNKSAYIINDEVIDLKIKSKNSNYYMPVSFQKAEVKEYEDYLYDCAKFIYDNFDSLKTNPLSYFGSSVYSSLTADEFIGETSNYSFLFDDKDYDFLPEPSTETETESSSESKSETTANED